MRDAAVATGAGTFISALAPAIFGRMIQALDGGYWSGFLFLGLANLANAACYFALHRVSARASLAAVGLNPISSAVGNSPDGISVAKP